MKLQALIFDVDGTLADTERYGHLPACNEAMTELNLGIEWSWEKYKTMIQTIPGSVNRLIYELDKRSMTKEKKEKTVKLFRTLKQNLYVIKYLPEIKLRKGIENIIRQAIDQNVKLAIVSSSHEKQINALLKSQLVEFYDKFVIVLGKESGKKTDNNGFLHKKCLGQLGVKKENAIVIEDAGDGLRAATLAGISTAVFYNDYTFGDDFRHAKLVAPSIDFFSLKLLTEICLSKINQ